MDNSIRFLKDEITKYRGQFGPHPLTEKEREKVEELLEQLRYVPDPDNDAVTS
ncbi:MAG: hypothetical protein WA364_12120 [Candidatus Nitrosopolaris sp.]